MITILLEQIIELIKGWISAFTDHAQHVEDKLDSIDSTASDIKDNTDSLPDIEDNTAAVITPINNIKTNTDSIASSNTAISNNTTAISNQVSSMSTNVGRAAAYAEDCANNSLNILDKVTTIASDTTQIRTDTGNMSLEQSKIYDAVKWLLADKTIDETEEGQDSITFNTDIADDLIDLTVELVATQSGSGNPTPINKRPINGYSSINLIVNGTTIGISLGDTYYSGIVDITTGTITIDKKAINLGSLTYTYNASLTRFNASMPADYKKPTTTAERIDFLCSIFTPDSSPIIGTNINYTICGYTNSNTIYINDYDYTDGSQLANALSGEILLYKLDSPIALTFTPQQIAAIKGDNTIATDTNGKVTVTYTESIKHYLDKQDNA